MASAPVPTPEPCDMDFLETIRVRFGTAIYQHFRVRSDMTDYQYFDSGNIGYYYVKTKDIII